MGFFADLDQVLSVPARPGGPVVAVLHEGRTAEAAELICFARERLAAYKSPKSVRFVPSIPLSPVGKPLRRALREPFWQGRERRI